MEWCFKESKASYGRIPEIVIWFPHGFTCTALSKWHLSPVGFCCLFFQTESLRCCDEIMERKVLWKIKIKQCANFLYKVMMNWKIRRWVSLWPCLMSMVCAWGLGWGWEVPRIMPGAGCLLESPPPSCLLGRVRIFLATPTSWSLLWGPDEIMHVKHPLWLKCLEKVPEPCKCIGFFWGAAWHLPGRPMFLALAWDFLFQSCFESHLIEIMSSCCK